jgi:pimeloyl-ACP methyl ester carboxylesterase
MMRKILRVMAIFLLVLLGLLLLVPLIFPFPQLSGVRDPRELADPDSQFVEVDGVELHYKQYGSGEPVMVLLHGFAASTFSFREVVEPLSRLGTVIVYDRPGQGLTERPLYGSWSGDNPYSPDTQPRLLMGLLDHLGVERAILLGNSAGGGVATLAALEYPERVQALVLIDAAVYESGPSYPAWVRRLLFTPQAGWYGPLLLRSFATRGLELLNTAWHDPSKIPADTIPGSTRALQAKDWDRGLWELTRAPRDTQIAPRLGELRLPVLVITGDDDRIVPTQSSVRLSQEIPGARLAVMQACGHVPHEECPNQFLEAVVPFLQGLS